ncbi:unnamed protein product [Acanthoscelides obtectus]|uniref:Uncharacterized protein n=1 Tax=Acanthoscelides obtectus TaxID=200917 RepID=A0A9P0L6S9_ACAOB|nr:unnamed protein product [Acanthoscelides obtectus]CAK1627779.1 hypothetical protein AOBTE_LOCUS4818 [Acanthoscelides obtectus]
MSFSKFLAITILPSSIGVGTKVAGLAVLTVMLIAKMNIKKTCL